MGEKLTFMSNPKSKWRFLLLASTVISLLGLHLTLRSATEAWLGKTVLAFFLPGIVVSIMFLVKKNPAIRMKSEFVVRNSSWTSIAYIFLCSGWLIGSLLLMNNRPESAGIAVILAYICAFGLVVSFWQLLDSRPIVRIDDKGYFDRSLGVGVIPWDEIAGAHIEDVQGTEVLKVDLVNPEKFSIPETLSRKLDRLFGFELLHLGIVRMDVAYLDEALDFVLERCVTTKIAEENEAFDILESLASAGSEGDEPTPIEL